MSRLWLGERLFQHVDVFDHQFLFLIIIPVRVTALDLDILDRLARAV